MAVVDIIRGESKKVEFKETLPNRSENYAKTVVAYSNSQGGQIVFGVVDDTREVVGIDEADLFQTMDAIANAISDSCEPQIIPEIEPCSIDGKTVIVVTVVPGTQRPYYLKSKGKETGTFVRVGGTTRPASPEKIKELEMEGAKISWDELTCIGYKVTDKAIKKLCGDMNARRKAMQNAKGLSKPLSAVTRTNLENWKVLRKTGDEELASNAFVLLTSDYFPFSKTQCAVFKGKDRAVFLDKREYTGPIYEQIEEAVDFVLRNIRLGAKIKGLQREESYELPPEAIREMIVNAHCHRNYTAESCVQVAVYDDRLEVTSPGGLYNGLTFEEALQGHSKLRNRAIANVFSQMGLVEAWGTGLQRIRSAAHEYGLLDPEFIETAEMFRVNMYRKDKGEKFGESSEKFGESSVKFGESSGKPCSDSDENDNQVVSDTQGTIIKMIETDNQITSSEMAKRLRLSVRAIEKNIKNLRDRGIIVRHGAARGGYWEVKN